MKTIPLLFTMIFGVMTAVQSTQAVEPPTEAEAASEKLISAIQADNYADFTANGNDGFKKITKVMFDSVSAQIAPRFKAGYQVTYLGEMKQSGYQVTLWKLTFKDGGDDILATLSLKNGEIGGYWLK